MEKTLSDLRRLTIAATDGNLGSVVDLCFDDRSWTIRYLVVDAGSWFPDRWVLISPISVRSWAPDPSILRGELSKAQVKSSVEAHILNGQPETPQQPHALEHAIRDCARARGEAHLQLATAAMATPSRRRTARSATSRISSSMTRLGQSATCSWTPRIGGWARRCWCHRRGSPT